MSGAIACVVEGHGDVRSVPILVRRLAAERGVVVQVPRPARLGRSKFGRPDEVRGAAILAVAQAGVGSPLLVLADADDDCPVRLAHELHDVLTSAHDVTAAAVVLAVREYEAWFLAAASSVAGRRGLRGDLQPPGGPEAVRGAKEWLKRQQNGPGRYSETVDQPALTAVFDLEQAMASRSFRKCRKEIERLIDLTTAPVPDA